MWTAERRDRMARIEKKTKRYPSDLTDEEWAAMAPFLPQPHRTGRRRRTDLREVLNAIRTMVRSVCEWRILPVHFPPWQTVYWWFRRFVRLLLFRTIQDVVLMIDRARSERAAQPSADMSLEAVNRRLAFVFHPPRIIIRLAGGGDDRRVDKRAGLDPNRPGFELAGDRLEHGFVQPPCAISTLRKRTKAVRSGVGFDAENPQNRRKEARSSRASASLTSERSYQTAISSARNTANGGQAGSRPSRSRG
jgi:transposase